MTARLLIGDVFERLHELPDNSVDLVMTSPPFLALRSYLPDDHPNKGKELGAELAPADYLDNLLEVTAILRDKLTEHGSLVIELGDTYAGSGGAGGDYRTGKLRSGQPKFRQGTPRWDGQPGQRNTTSDPTTLGGRGGVGWPLPKSLCGIPTLFAWSLAYGQNLLTGQHSPAGQWRIRNLVHWVRTNPPVGALGDKFRPATSYLIIACTSAKRWFDLDAVRVPYSANSHARVPSKAPSRFDLPSQQRDGNWSSLAQQNNDPGGGAPPLDWWKLSARGYKGAHYAVYPPELCEKPIKAMCPERVCTTCGEPSLRITKAERKIALERSCPADAAQHEQGNRIGWHTSTTGTGTTRETVGWSDCGHNSWRRGVVLDPFAGTCTTLLVANELGRDAIGIDLDARNADLGKQRLWEKGFFLKVDGEAA